MQTVVSNLTMKFSRKQTAVLNSLNNNIVATFSHSLTPIS